MYKYIGFVGSYTLPGQADPFEGSLGGYPHDRSKVGTGVLAIGVDAAGKLSFLNDGEAIIKGDELQNPSYLCVLGRSSSSSRPKALRDGALCIVSELKEGKFQSFAVSLDRSGMKIDAKAVGEALDTGGSYPCHIVSSNVGSNMECVFVCNYGEDEGVLSIFGNATEQSDSYTRQVRIPLGLGSNADPDRQEASHAHSTSVLAPMSPTSLMDLCCADLGSDAIVQFSMNICVPGANGEVSLQCVEKEKFAAPPASGPRSLTFNPLFGDVAIVSLELTAQVCLVRRKTDDGSFVGLGDPVSVLPEEWPGESAPEKKFNHGRWASDALWSPDGKFAYAAVRLHNSISVFQISTTGGAATEVKGLELVQRISTKGLTPRCLCMSECGEFILVAHQHSHEISSFRRNESDGTISHVDQLEVPNAACVKLIRPDQIGSFQA